MRMMTPCAMVCGLLAGLAGPALAADDAAPAATPYRPSVSTPAALSAPGWLEIEAGLQHDRAGDSLARRDSVPLTWKLAFTPDWGLRLNTEAAVRTRDEDGHRSHGGGDTGMVVKRRFAVSDDAAFGLEAGLSRPGGGGTDKTLTGIFSTDLPASLHTDLNLAATRPAGGGATQWGWAASLSGALNDQWGLGAELSGTHAASANSRQLLLAGSFSATRALVLDAGFSHGLGRAAQGGHDRSVFVGLTWLALKLF